MAIFCITAAFICAIAGNTLTAFHIRDYRRLYQSLCDRGMPIADLYVEGLDYGSRGCVPKIKVISERLKAYGAVFTPHEEALAARSSRMYSSGGVIGVLGFITFIGLFFFSLRQ